MDNKEIKQRLADACLLVRDASMAWPRYPEQVMLKLAAALEIVDDIKPEIVGGEYYDARAWARVWKRAARGYRANYLWGKRMLDWWSNEAANTHNLYTGAVDELVAKDAEIERLRGVLRALYGTYGVTKAWQRKWPNINATVLNTLKEADHD